MEYEIGMYWKKYLAHTAMIYKTRLISGEILKNQKENHTFFKKRKIDVVNHAKSL